MALSNNDLLIVNRSDSSFKIKASDLKTYVGSGSGPSPWTENSSSGSLYPTTLTNKVGIGTNDPSVDLEVSSGLPRFKLTNSSDDSECELLNNSGKLSIRADEGSKSSSSYIDIRVQADEKMRIKSNGNVGIGTSNPDYRLHVRAVGADSDGGGEIAKFGRYVKDGERSLLVMGSDEKGAGGSSYIGFKVDNTGAPFSIANKDGNRNFTILENGKVGIGTTAPDGRLDVAFNGDNAIVTRREVSGVASNQNISIGSSVVGNRIISGFDSSNAKPLSFIQKENGNPDEVHCMTLSADGYVGLGDTAVARVPKYPLDVSATTQREFVVGQGLNANYVMIGSKDIDPFNDTESNAYLTIESYATNFNVEGVNNAMRIENNTGNVGIGTSNPDHKLHVDGDLAATNYRIDLLDELL